jgi:hypothetical protein
MRNGCKREVRAQRYRRVNCVVIVFAVFPEVIQNPGDVVFVFHGHKERAAVELFLFTMTKKVTSTVPPLLLRRK